MRASGKVEATGAARGIPVRIAAPGSALRVHDAGHGLDDGARFRRDVLLRARTSLLPIFADQVLKVGAFGFGWLRAAPALGALVGSIYTSLKPIPRAAGARLPLGRRRLRLRDDRLRPVAQLRADVRRARRDRARRSRLDRRAPDRAADDHARRDARAHDQRQHDLLHGRARSWASSRRGSSRRCSPPPAIGATVSVVSGGRRDRPRRRRCAPGARRSCGTTTRGTTPQSDASRSPPRTPFRKIFMPSPFGRPRSCELALGPLRMVERVEVGVGVRHQAEQAPRRIAHAGDRTAASRSG